MNNWTQKELAERIGCTDSYISQIESYARGVDDETFDRFAAVFGTRFSMFFMGEDAPAKPVIERKPSIAEALQVVANSKEYSFIKTRHINQLPPKKS